MTFWFASLRSQESDKVKIALRTLTLLFIGGASSAAELLSCQYEDGGAGVERLEVPSLQSERIPFSLL